mmetsp:Transcript_19620/g.54548  ORF Transcript_19620/g.54548 Transcript_19620/m.54548 type:complete len:217 (+) Transcript_19620:809-1459(+)
MPSLVRSMGKFCLRHCSCSCSIFMANGTDPPRASRNRGHELTLASHPYRSRLRTSGGPSLSPLMALIFLRRLEYASPGESWMTWWSFSTKVSLDKFSSSSSLKSGAKRRKPCPLTATMQSPTRTPHFLATVSPSSKRPMVAKPGVNISGGSSLSQFVSWAPRLPCGSSTKEMLRSFGFSLDVDSNSGFWILDMVPVRCGVCCCCGGCCCGYGDECV